MYLVQAWRYGGLTNSNPERSYPHVQHLVAPIMRKGFHLDLLTSNRYRAYLDGQNSAYRRSIEKDGIKVLEQSHLGRGHKAWQPWGVSDSELRTFADQVAENLSINLKENG